CRPGRAACGAAACRPPASPPIDCGRPNRGHLHDSRRCGGALRHLSGRGPGGRGHRRGGGYRPSGAAEAEGCMTDMTYRPTRAGIGPIGVTALVAAIFVLLFLAGIGFGSTWIPLEHVAHVLFGGGDKTERLVVLQLRLPRVAAAAIAGGAIAFAGYLLQRITRNELASPGILGVVDGAALGVVMFMAIFSNESNALAVSVAWQPLAAILGAVAAIGLVFLLSGRQASSAIRLILF